MKPFCAGCPGILIKGTDCRLCPKWNRIVQRYSLLAKKYAEAEKKLLLASQLIELQVIDEWRDRNGTSGLEVYNSGRRVNDYTVLPIQG